MWGRLTPILMIFVGGAGLAVAAVEDPFTSGTEALGKMNKNMDDGIKTIEAIRVRALRDGEALKVSCVEEKLRRARAKRTQARTDEKAWAATRDSAAEQEKVLSTMRVHELYVFAFVEEARACVSAQAVKTGAVVKVEGVATEPPVLDPVPPPLLERPVLASSF